MKRLIRMLKRWLLRRQWKLFLLGLPSVLAVGLFLFVFVVVSGVHHHHDKMQKTYQRFVAESLSTTNYESARVASLRGLAEAQSDPDRADWLFYLALALNGQGRPAEAAALLAQAAPLDQPGSVQAQLMTAQNLLSSTNLNAETLRLAERHLLNALAKDSNSIPANEMLGRFYINTHRLADAQAHLLKIPVGNPDAALLLAISFDMQKNSSSASLWADRAVTAIRKKLVATAPQNLPVDRYNLVHALNIRAKYDFSLLDPLERAMLSGTNAAPQDNPPVWLDLVRSLMIGKKYMAARETLEQAAQISPSPAYPPMMADICAALAENLPADHGAERLQLIQKGLENNPQHARLRWLLIQASYATGDSGPAAKQFLVAQMASANVQSAAGWQFLLATDCRFHGDLPAARQHLQAAYDLAPNIPEIQNDIAWELLTGKPQNLPRALELIESALKQLPDNPNFHDTRGRILAALGRKSEAITDLEFAAAHLTGTDAKETQALLTQLNASSGATSVPQAKLPPTKDRLTERLRKVQGLVATEKYAAALDLLDQGMSLNPNPKYANAIADVCAVAAVKASLSTKDNLAERLRLIQKGLGQVPDHPKLCELLVQTAHASTNAASAAQRLLDQSVAAATGNAAVNWQLILGQAARSWGDAAGARQHFQKAYQLAPNLTQTRYELAVALCGGSWVDCEQGLKLIDYVLDKFPFNPEYRCIRGQMLAGLGRNKEAAKDLEYAVAHLPAPGDIRLVLASVYDAMGDTQLAEKQRQMAKTNSPGH